jgi:hypothetical protein
MADEKWRWSRIGGFLLPGGAYAASVPCKRAALGIRSSRSESTASVESTGFHRGITFRAILHTLRKTPHQKWLNSTALPLGEYEEKTQK